MEAKFRRERKSICMYCTVCIIHCSLLFFHLNGKKQGSCSVRDNNTRKWKSKNRQCTGNWLKHKMRNLDQKCYYDLTHDYSVLYEPIQYFNFLLFYDTWSTIKLTKEIRSNTYIISILLKVTLPCKNISALGFPIEYFVCPVINQRSLIWNAIIKKWNHFLHYLFYV